MVLYLVQCVLALGVDFSWGFSYIPQQVIILDYAMRHLGFLMGFSHLALFGQ
jgi:hypothetical protein